MLPSKIGELFCFSTSNAEANWFDLSEKQNCVFLDKKCIKTRKSQPHIAIGTCSVKYGTGDVIICPKRLLEGRKIFMDCIHLLTMHQPGNEIHVVSEIGIPGGSIDYFIVSARQGKVEDFVGIELQTLDTTGTLWPERQRFLQSVGLPIDDIPVGTYGMNWKMTAKTILMQLHHKIKTFEHLNKHLVLVLQDDLLKYIRREFAFEHISKQARLGEPMHFHAYEFLPAKDGNYSLQLHERLSTDSLGIAACLGLQAEAAIELEVIVKTLERKISNRTRLTI